MPQDPDYGSLHVTLLSCSSHIGSIMHHLSTHRRHRDILHAHNAQEDIRAGHRPEWCMLRRGPKLHGSETATCLLLCIQTILAADWLSCARWEYMNNLTTLCLHAILNAAAKLVILGWMLCVQVYKQIASVKKMPFSAYMRRLLKQYGSVLLPA